ncbi:MAG: 30S ribosomal protein S1 [Clostridia bacterium]|nr:30S ribosomal protein S1 [Clostridia bacterium]
MKKYLPEGMLLEKEENIRAMASPSALKEAMMSRRILEARTLVCDSEHNLHVDLGCMRGIIERTEGAIGLEEGEVRDIALISRVNKPVCFYVIGFTDDADGNICAKLSRKMVQTDCINNYLSKLNIGDIIDARVTHAEYFGAFVDVGAGVSALLPIDAISVSRIPHPSERFVAGDDIRAIVKKIDEQGRLTLSHKELLGTWEENASLFKVGETVAGVVRSVEDYGVFIELAPNLAGLAELVPGISPGQQAGVYIKSITPERMKIKLVIVDAFNANYKNNRPKYFYKGDHIDYFRYSPSSCSKVIESKF